MCRSQGTACRRSPRQSRLPPGLDGSPPGTPRTPSGTSSRGRTGRRAWWGSRGRSPGAGEGAAGQTGRPGGAAKFRSDAPRPRRPPRLTCPPRGAQSRCPAPGKLSGAGEGDSGRAGTRRESPGRAAATAPSRPSADNLPRIFCSAP